MPTSEKAAAPDPIIQLIVFRLGQEEYAIRIEQVKEVTLTPEIARMPKTPSFVKGIANLRGDIIAVVDLEERFQLREATEELAAIEDEESEEDVLVLSRNFNLAELVEDELLMALPVAPKHEVCPKPVKLSVADADFAEEPEEKPNPFAVLQQLKKTDLG